MLNPTFGLFRKFVPHAKEAFGWNHPRAQLKLLKRAVLLHPE